MMLEALHLTSYHVGISSIKSNRVKVRIIIVWDFLVRACRASKGIQACESHLFCKIIPDHLSYLFVNDQVKPTELPADVCEEFLNDKVPDLDIHRLLE